MTEYWESKYSNEGALWKFEPADSALIAAEMFRSENLQRLLIPGVGYGRNAKFFLDRHFEVTGIEISAAAIALARSNGMNFTIHHGSVTEMPFDEDQYDGIYCYALLHLLNKNERRRFLSSCYDQLGKNGLMIFVVATRELSLYGSGRDVSKDRYRLPDGLTVFFFDDESISAEFKKFGLIRLTDIKEPIKFADGYDPMPLKFVVCRKF